MLHATVVKGWCYVPLSEIGGRMDVEDLVLRLTHKPKFAEKGTKPLALYDLSRRGYLGVPRPFGRERFSHLPVIDETSLGQPMIDRHLYRRPNPYHPSVLNPQAQAKFMAELHAAMLEHQTFLATAPTGSGKTVSFLDAALQLGRKTFVACHLERLMLQWGETLEGILGVPAHRIGYVQGPRCEYEGKDFVIGMLPSLNMRAYPPEFYEQFGLVGFDEVHRIGSELFAPSVAMFPARYKVGLSATLDRADGGAKVFVWHLGPIRVRSTAEAMPMDVFTVPYANRSYNPQEKFKQGPKDGPIVAKALARDGLRNRFLVQWIKRFYTRERQALVVGSNVKHLQLLMEMCVRDGIPPSAMGQFTGEVHYKTVVGGKTVWKKRKQKADVLTHVREHCQIVFATYGMLTEGIDIPRLDAGIDVTPSGSATQLVGRIRRPRPDKKRPVWVTPHDTDCPLARRNFTSRCKDYLASNASVINHGTPTSEPHS